MATPEISPEKAGPSIAIHEVSPEKDEPSVEIHETSPEQAAPSRVPIIDLEAFIADTLEHTETERLEVARSLNAHLHKNGFVAITGHGIPLKVLKEAFDRSSSLFALPHEQKILAQLTNTATSHRGYTRAVTKTVETDDVGENKNVDVGFKESFEIGSEYDKEKMNIWYPEEVLPGFPVFMSDFYWAVDKVADALLEALIKSLGLTEHEAAGIKALHKKSNNVLRLLHYPPVEKTMLGNVDRLGGHTDWCSFTLLFQDSAGGLEFRDDETGDFVPAVPMEGVLYMNIGDMFERISNGYYRSSVHRVVISGEKSGESTPSRYSMPYFVLPQEDMEIAPAPSLVEAHGKELYESTTYKYYSTMKFEALGLPVGETSHDREAERVRADTPPVGERQVDAWVDGIDDTMVKSETPPIVEIEIDAWVDDIGDRMDDF